MYINDKFIINEGLNLKMDLGSIAYWDYSVNMIPKQNYLFYPFYRLKLNGRII